MIDLTPPPPILLGMLAPFPPALRYLVLWGLTLPWTEVRVGEAKSPGPPPGGCPALGSHSIGPVGHGVCHFADPDFPLPVDVRLSFSKYRSEAVVAVNSKATGARIRFVQAHQAASAQLALHRRPGAFLRVDFPPVSVFPHRLMWRALCLSAARCPPSFPSLCASSPCRPCVASCTVPRDSLVVRLSARRDDERGLERPLVVSVQRGTFASQKLRLALGRYDTWSPFDVTRESGTFDGDPREWDSARPPGHSPRPPEGDLCAKYALVMPTSADDAVKVGGTGLADTFAMKEAIAINVEDADPWWRLPLPQLDLGSRDLGARANVASGLFDLPTMPPPSVSLKTEVVCGRLPRPPEARPSCGALAVNLLSTSHPPPSQVDFQDFGPPPQGSVAPKLEPGTHLSQVTNQDIGPPPQPACSLGAGPDCSLGVAVAVPGDRNCANEVDPGCLHSRSCANELGPDALRIRSGVCEVVPDRTRPSDATVVATGCACCCANGIDPDSGSCAIDPAVTAGAHIAPASLVPICPCGLLVDGSKFTVFDLVSSNPYWRSECLSSWSPKQAARSNDRDVFAEVCRVVRYAIYVDAWTLAEAIALSGTVGTDPGTGNKVPPISA